ncbi:MAG: hypothetical protein ACTSV7_06990 [Candidatus Baldrarchaeia archaeon]
MAQAQTGHTPKGPTGGALKSTPKLTRINGDDGKKIIYRNLGNNHAYPFVWADHYQIDSGDNTKILASGIKFHGFDLASYANIVATPTSSLVATTGFYIDKDTVNNVVRLKTTANVVADIGFDVQFMLGLDADVDNLTCRGTGGSYGNPRPSLP